MAAFMEEDAADDALLVERIDAKLREDYGLSKMGSSIVRTWIRAMAKEVDDETIEAKDRKLERARRWLFRQLIGKCPEPPASEWQRGCPELVPGLRAIAKWSPEKDLSRGCSELRNALQSLEASVDVVRGELENALRRCGKTFQPYRAPTWANPTRPDKDGLGSLGHDSGDWNVLYLKLHNVSCDGVSDSFPKTLALLDAIPGLYPHAFFSSMSPSTHIAKHNGPSNKKLRVHLPIIVPSEGTDASSPCRLRVGRTVHEFKEGELFIFDDSFDHEAWNDHPSRSRVCLIVDIWHPDFSAPEIKFMSFLEKGKLKRAKRMCEQAEGDLGDNFYALLKKTKQVKVSTDSILGR